MYLVIITYQSAFGPHTRVLEFNTESEARESAKENEKNNPRIFEAKELSTTT